MDGLYRVPDNRRRMIRIRTALQRPWRPFIPHHHARALHNAEVAVLLGSSSESVAQEHGSRNRRAPSTLGIGLVCTTAVFDRSRPHRPLRLRGLERQLSQGGIHLVGQLVNSRGRGHQHSPPEKVRKRKRHKRNVPPVTGIIAALRHSFGWRPFDCRPIRCSERPSRFTNRVG